MYDCIDVFKPVDRGWVSPGFSHLLTCMRPVPGIFVSSVQRRESDEKHGFNINTKRQAPWNFQNACTILNLFFGSLIPSTIGLLETNEKNWQTFAANKIKLLQIKTSKVCARSEGWRSGYYDFHIFERGAVILFSWPVWLFGQTS